VIRTGWDNTAGVTGRDTVDMGQWYYIVGLKPDLHESPARPVRLQAGLQPDNP
jgi:hypothetical protein